MWLLGDCIETINKVYFHEGPADHKLEPWVA